MESVGRCYKEGNMTVITEGGASVRTEGRWQGTRACLRNTEGGASVSAEAKASGQRVVRAVG